MIYNHYTQPKIFSESSKNCQKQVLFTPTETSPISYSTQTLNSKEKYLRKINTDDLETIKKIKFNIPESNCENSRTSSPEINRRRLDDDIDNDINIEFHPIKKKSGNSKSQARGIKKSLKLFNEQFDTLVGTITSNPKKDFISNSIGDGNFLISCG